MTRRLVLSYTLIAALVLGILAVPLGLVTARLERDQLVVALERDAAVIASRVEEALEAGAVQIDPGLDAYLATTNARVLIVDGEGISVFDPDNPDVRRDYSTRPEITAALEGRRSTGTRRSDTLATGLLFVAVPVASGNAVEGAVRLTHTTADLDSRIRSVWTLLGGIALVSLSLTTLVGLLLAGWVTRPTDRLAAAVTDFAAGNLEARAPTDRGPAEIRDLAQRVNRMAGRLSELLASQQQFVAAASHQLRSPLAATRLELEAALAVDPPDAGAIERALQETQRLGHVIDGLLALARTEGTASDVRPIDVAEIAAGRVSLWGALAEEDGVVLTMVPGPAVTAIAVDGHVEQILDNLIANALDVATEGTAVAVGWEDGEDGIIVTVTDDGPGLSNDNLEAAFDRFWSQSGADGGSGLGLPIARQLARVGGGDVRLRHAPGTGIRAELLLQRA